MLRERAALRFEIILHEEYNLLANALKSTLEEALCEWLEVLPESLCVNEIKPTESGQALAEVEIAGNIHGVSLADTARLLQEKASSSAFAGPGGPIRVAVQNVRVELMPNAPKAPKGECAGPSPAGNAAVAVHRDYIDDYSRRLSRKKEAVGRSYREWFPYDLGDDSVLLPYLSSEYKQLYAIVVALKLQENLPPSEATESEEIAPAYSEFRVHASQQHKLTVQNVDQAVLEFVAREIICHRVLEFETDRGDGFLDETQLATQIHDAINLTLSLEWVAETLRQVLDEMQIERQKTERAQLQKHMIRAFLEKLKRDVAARQQDKDVLLDPKKFKVGPGGKRKMLDHDQISQLWIAFFLSFLEPIVQKQSEDISHAFLIVLFPEFSPLLKKETSRSLSSEMRPWKLFLECLLMPGASDDNDEEYKMKRLQNDQEIKSGWRQTLERWDAFLRKFRSEFDSILESEYRKKYRAFLESWVRTFDLIVEGQCTCAGDITLSTRKERVEDDNREDKPPARVVELEKMQSKLAEAIQRWNPILLPSKSDDKLSNLVRCKTACGGSLCGGYTIWQELVLAKENVDSQMFQAATVLTEVLKEHLAILQVEASFLLSLAREVVFNEGPPFDMDNFVYTVQQDLGRDDGAVRNLLRIYIPFLDQKLMDYVQGQKVVILLKRRWRKIQKKQQELKEKEKKELAERKKRLKGMNDMYEELRALVYPRGPIESEYSLLKHLAGYQIETIRAIVESFIEKFGSVFDIARLHPDQYRQFRSQMAQRYFKRDGKDRTHQDQRKKHERGGGVDLIIQIYLAPLMVCVNFVTRLAPAWATDRTKQDRIESPEYSQFINDMHRAYRQFAGATPAFVHQLVSFVFFKTPVVPLLQPQRRPKRSPRQLTNVSLVLKIRRQLLLYFRQWFPAVLCLADLDFCPGFDDFQEWAIEELNIDQREILDIIADYLDQDSKAVSTSTPHDSGTQTSPAPAQSDATLQVGTSQLNAMVQCGEPKAILTHDTKAIQSGASMRDVDVTADPRHFSRPASSQAPEPVVQRDVTAQVSDSDLPPLPPSALRESRDGWTPSVPHAHVACHVDPGLLAPRGVDAASEAWSEQWSRGAQTDLVKSRDTGVQSDFWWARPMPPKAGPKDRTQTTEPPYPRLSGPPMPPDAETSNRGPRGEPPCPRFVRRCRKDGDSLDSMGLNTEQWAHYLEVLGELQKDPGPHTSCSYHVADDSPTAGFCVCECGRRLVRGVEVKPWMHGKTVLRELQESVGVGGDNASFPLSHTSCSYHRSHGSRTTGCCECGRNIVLSDALLA